MPNHRIITVPNVDLTVVEGNKSRWTHADHRRHGLHNLHRLARYCTSFRAHQVMPLKKRMDLRIAELDSVRQLTGLPWFSGMVVIRDQQVLFERYASDFGPNRVHSIQSITKTLMNLAVGQLVEGGLVDPARKVADYIPEIGSGYADATVQQVLNMDVVNEYVQDFADPIATYYDHEEAMGWRLPQDPKNEVTMRGFLPRIASADIANVSGHAQYKDANSDVLGWIVESAGGRSLRSYIADIIDAAGLEGTFYITTDREGVPTLDGGACMTARDLARYFSLFVRRGVGVGGEIVGSASFIDQTLRSGIPMPQPWEGIRYSNQMMVSGVSLGHGGWAGQYVVANMATGAIGVFFSVLETQHAITRDYIVPVVRMLESIACMDF